MSVRDYARSDVYPPKVNAIDDTMTCSNDGHVPGCPCRAGGDAEFITVPLDEMRCESCGRRVDDMDPGDCNACERRWASWQRAEW